jgi:outer membrane protein TolC
MTGRAPLALGLAALAASLGCSLTGGERFARENTESVLAARAPRLDPRDLAPQAAPIAQRETAPLREPLALERALVLAVETSESLRAAGETVYQTHLQEIEALSDVLPHGDYLYTYFRQEDDFPKVNGVSSPFFLKEQRTSQFQLRQALFHLGSYLAVKAAASAIGAAEARLRNERLLVERATAAVFYEALTAERQRATFEAAAERDEERLREVTGRVEAGLARRTEALFVETDLARTRASLADAVERTTGARERLALLVGRPVMGALLEPVPPPALAPAALAARPLPSLVDQAFAERPDLAALREDMAVAGAARAAALAGFAPQVDLTANYYTHRDGTLANVEWDVGVVVDMPIFEGLLTSARAREAESRERQASFLFRAEGRAVAAEVTAAWHAVRGAGAARAAQEDALRTAEDNFRQLAAEYAVGLATNLELVTAQQELTSARLAYETTRLDEQRLAIELRFLVGEYEPAAPRAQ